LRNLQRHRFYALSPHPHLPSSSIFALSGAAAVAAAAAGGGAPQQAETIGWLDGRRQPAELVLGGYPSEGRMTTLASQSAAARASFGAQPGAAVRGRGCAAHSSIVPEDQ
jgi:hypothetical protein